MKAKLHICYKTWGRPRFNHYIHFDWCFRLWQTQMSRWADSVHLPVEFWFVLASAVIPLILPKQSPSPIHFLAMGVCICLSRILGGTSFFRRKYTPDPKLNRLSWIVSGIGACLTENNLYFSLASITEFEIAYGMNLKLCWLLLGHCFSLCSIPSACISCWQANLLWKFCG